MSNVQACESIANAYLANLCHGIGDQEPWICDHNFNLIRSSIRCRKEIFDTGPSDWGPIRVEHCDILEAIGRKSCELRKSSNFNQVLTCIGGLAPGRPRQAVRDCR